MDKKTLRRFELRAEMFKALAHPMRLAMLERLKQRNWCVCELASEIGIEKSVASKHLSQLKGVGLVDYERRGTIVEYRLVAPCVLDMASCAEAAIVAGKKRELEAAAGA